MKYEPKTKRALAGGTQDLYELSSGYGASVVRNPYSYGGASGLFELAVIEWDDKHVSGWNLVTDVPGAHDVRGWLTAEQVQEALAELDRFPGVRGRCELKRDGCQGHGRRTLDPYAYEIAGERHMIYMCKSCYVEQAADI